MIAINKQKMILLPISPHHQFITHTHTNTHKTEIEVLDSDDEEEEYSNTEEQQAGRRKAGRMNDVSSPLSEAHTHTKTVMGVVSSAPLSPTSTFTYTHTYTGACRWWW